MRDVRIAILRLLGESGLWLTPNNIAKNIEYSSGYIRKECKELLQMGLIVVDSDAGDPFYHISEKGDRFLSGDLDASELEDDDD